MRKLRIFILSALLITTSASFAYPQVDLFQLIKQLPFEECEESTCPYSINNLLSSYDLFLQLLDDIETGELENKCSARDIVRINHFLALLARIGHLPGDDELQLEKDIEELLSDEDDFDEDLFSFGRNHGYLFAPEALNETYEILPCDHVSRAWKKVKKGTRRFVKQNKKGIIIGGAVLLGGVGVVLAVASCAATATAAAVAGATGVATSCTSSKASSSGSSNSESSKAEQKKEPALVCSSKEPLSSVVGLDEAPIIKETLDEHVASFKQVLIEDKMNQKAIPSKWDDLSFKEKTRELVAHFAHQAYEEVTELAQVVPELCEEVKEIGSKLLPECLMVPNSGDTESSIENFENLVSQGHEAIDQVFSTDQAEQFTAEAKANNPMNNFAFGMIPIPGTFNKIFSNAAQFKEAGRVLDRAGFTKAGRALMKHGNRKGSVFPKPIGNPAEMNKRGHVILEEILDDPNNQVYRVKNGGIKVYSSNGRGASFENDGSFRGFVERQYEK